ncbi:MAG: carboxymuconolactone decarboxylase family protein [Acidobacteriota bacterium]|nr:carboxymuconolactone decarboxylase family protein [Acidobacteriota bacterium]
MRTQSNETAPASLFASIQYRPESVRTLAKLHDLLMGTGALKARTRALVYLAVAIVNESPFCIRESELRARELGITEDESRDVEAETDYSFPEKERIALRFARELTRTADAERRTLEMLDTFFTAEERAELTMVISLANMTTRIANGLRISSGRSVLRVAS